MMERKRKDDVFYAQGLNFSCLRCSACCRFEAGFVFLSQKDLNALAAALGQKQETFIGAYCRWVPSAGGSSQLSLREKSNLDCVFWKNGCTVYENRPLQCRAFPFWHSNLASAESWEGVANDCPGMGGGSFHSRESIEYWLALRRREPIITRGVS